MSLSNDNIFKSQETEIVKVLVDYGCSKEGAEKVLETYAKSIWTKVKSYSELPGMDKTKMDKPDVEELFLKANGGEPMFHDRYFMELVNEARASNNGK